MYIKRYELLFMANNIAIGHIVHNSYPSGNCDVCQKVLSEPYTHLKFDHIKLNETAYCLPCLNSALKNVEEIVQKNKLLEERLNKLEQFVQDVWDYSPGGSGYNEAKNHFENSTKS
ncbi:hypothetical protein Klosneuvirus_3_210 [Klosneuvirus KNV1]|uniref:Uncharacterized protein n=1 Tax=Klosneuvirus KNV1 TaxID=1977640 RepID=A0A1V0SK11_9VIRU|nr:hypothetical protein Klosneuvirus_3_210 [Klosneuvirus KNV1]